MDSRELMEERESFCFGVVAPDFWYFNGEFSTYAQTNSLGWILCFVTYPHSPFTHMHTQS